MRNVLIRRRDACRRRLACAVLCLAPGAVLAGNVAWTGLDGGGPFWELPGNWNPGLPGTIDDALLGAFNTEFRTGNVGIRSFTGTGTLTFSGGGVLSVTNPSSTGGLTMNSGSLGGAGNLTVAGSTSIIFGDHHGTGTTTLQGPTSLTAVTANGGFRLDGGRTVVNQNTVTWDNGLILFNNTADGLGAGPGSGTFNNVPGASFIATGDFVHAMDVSDFGGNDTGADALFINSGTFTKSGSSAGHLTSINVPFTHAGPVNIQTGILSFNAGGAHPGTFALSPGAVLRFGAGTHTVSGTLTAPATSTVRLSGTSNVTFASPYTINGTLEMQGQLLNLGSNALTTASLVQGNGGISGTGSLTVTGPSTITYGDHRGTGTTILQGASSISVSGFRLDGGRTVVNHNTLTWSGGDVLFNNTFDGTGAGAGSGTFDNALDGTFVASGDFAGNLVVSGGTAGTDALFVNTGTFIKSGSLANHQTAINVPFTHAGPVNIETGILSFNAGGAHPGAFTLSPGATLRFDAGDHTVSGTLSAPAGSKVLVSGTSTVSFSNPYTIGGTLEMQNLMLNLGSSALITGNLLQSGGAINGTGPLTVTGTTTFLGGDHRGTGTTILQGPTSISNYGLRLDAGRTVVNQNTVTWTGGTLTFNNTYNEVGALPGSGTFHNAPGATFIASGGFAGGIDASDLGAGDNGSDALFINAGTFIKANSDPGHQTTIAVPLNNTGTIDVQTGVLALPINFTNNGTLKGVGTFLTNQVTNAGHVAPGASPGTLTLNGNFVQSAGGSLDIELSSLASSDLFTISGNASLGGTLALKCVPGSCNVATNDEYIVLHSTGTLSGTFANTTSAFFRPGFAYTVIYDYPAGNVKVKVTSAGNAPHLTVSRAGSGAGKVTSSDGFIDCGATCVHAYGGDATVTLTATADPGSTFVGWLGACRGTASNICIASVNGTVTVKATFISGAAPQHFADADGNAQFDALTDGMLIIRHLRGLTGPALTNGLVGAGNPSRTTSEQVAGWLVDVGPYLDVDANGVLDALTDGLLIIRYLLGLRGNALIQSALAPDANRTDPTEIANYLSTLLQ